MTICDSQGKNVVTCNNCNGIGTQFNPSTGYLDCENCKGSGVVTAPTLTAEEFEEIQGAHDNEELWRFFLYCNCPLESNAKYKELYYKVVMALEEYVTFMEDEAEKLNTEFNL